jgi:cytochrome c oxidase cbb3-type subunit 3
MPAEPRDQLLDHEYDGIREYDNPTPGWWHGIFVITIIFAIFYFMFWHMSPEAWTIHDRLAKDELANIKRQFADLGTLSADEPTLRRMMDDSKWLQVGASTFKGNCVSCHGALGQGSVGPNLTDDSWKNVKSLPDILRVVQEGAGSGAMPAWKARLHPNELVLVSAYVANLRGTNAAGKGPEGDLIPSWSK